nr:zinc knuckle CX2CX4HX4C [Tanacetum cinerariifolium]
MDKKNEENTDSYETLWRNPNDSVTSLSHPSQHYSITWTLDYAITSFKLARWKVHVTSIRRKPLEGLFNILGVSQDVVLLRVFSSTLTRSAKRWVDRLTPGAVNTWDLLKKAFIKRSAKRWVDRLTPGAVNTWDLLKKAFIKRNNSSNSNTDRLAAIVSKLDNLGRDMKKLKENVHAIQVGCQIYEGPHLDKECPLNEEVKQVEEAKYGKFGCRAPFNRSNGAKFCVGLSRYYTSIENRQPYDEKILSLEELMNKHHEESSRRSAQMDEWIKKLQENAKIDARNQSASLKYLET